MLKKGMIPKAFLKKHKILLLSILILIPHLFLNICFAAVTVLSSGDYYVGNNTIYRIPANSYIVNPEDNVFDTFLGQENLRDGGSVENADDEDREGTAEKYKVINKKGQIKYLIHRSHPPKNITPDDMVDEDFNSNYSIIVDGEEIEILNIIIPTHEHICYDGQGTGGKHYFDSNVVSDGVLC